MLRRALLIVGGLLAGTLLIGCQCLSGGCCGMCGSGPNMCGLASSPTDESALVAKQNMTDATPEESLQRAAEGPADFEQQETRRMAASRF